MNSFCLALATFIFGLASCSHAPSTNHAPVVSPATTSSSPPTSHPSAVTSESKNYRFVVTRLAANSDFDFQVEVSAKAANVAVDLKDFEIKIFWSQPSLPQAWMSDPKSSHIVLFKMDRGKYCWDHSFGMEITAPRGKTEHTKFFLSSLCESGH